MPALGLAGRGPSNKAVLPSRANDAGPPHGGWITRNKLRQAGRIGQHDGGNRAVSQDVVANRNLKIDKLLDHPMVYAFVMTADDDEMSILRERRGQRLVQASAGRRH